MTESATTRTGRRSAMSLRITRAARLLSDERGVEGFTMDELAAQADVSRRTLFNHCAGKLDAILGPAPTFPEEALAVFRGGGPHGDLLPDLRELAHATLEVEELDREDFGRVRRILLANPKLLGAAHDRFVTLSEQLTGETALREGADFGLHRAQVAIGIIGALLDAALTAFLEDEAQRPLAHHFDESVRFARELIG